MGIGGEITNTQKAKIETTYTLQCRDVYINGKNVDEVLKKAKTLMALGVKTITFQVSERTADPY